MQVFDIIDAHMHFTPDNASFTRAAQSIGEIYTEAGMSDTLSKAGIVHVIEQGTLNSTAHSFMSYCVGIKDGRDGNDTSSASDIEKHLNHPACVGMKVFAGYSDRELLDAFYTPFYELAAKYDKAVAIHTGVTAVTTGAKRSFLKYSHPLRVDEVATMFPDTNFVMCHFGNPWVTDAAAVLERHSNVVADLSGIFEVSLRNGFLDRQKRQIDNLRCWIAYVDNYSQFMFGTDYPLVNIADYIQFIKSIIPERHHKAVFYDNAKRVYKLSFESDSSR
jgi:hypothetical protein